MEIRKDIFNRAPEIGDIIVYMMPGAKVLLKGTVKEFSKLGLPIINKESKESIRTGFCIVKNL